MVKHLPGKHWHPVSLTEGDGNHAMSAMLAVGKIRFDWTLKRLRDINSNPWKGLESVNEECQNFALKRGRRAS